MNEMCIMAVQTVNVAPALVWRAGAAGSDTGSFVTGRAGGPVGQLAVDS
jgi:hypothetical protein